MPTVYVVQDNPYSPKNFNAARKYGELKTCVLGHVGLASLGQHCDELERCLRNITEEDWIIMTGHPVLMGVAGFIMGEQTGYVRCLAWDNQSNTYYPYIRKVYDE